MTATIAKTERNEKLIRLFLSGKTLDEIGQMEGITRERVRQVLTRELSIEPYLEQLYLNRQNRPHKLIKFTRKCKRCGDEFSGKEYTAGHFIMCLDCRKFIRRTRRLSTFTCQNCGVVKEYKTYKKKPTCCSNKCKMEWLHKLRLNKSIQ